MTDRQTPRDILVNPKLTLIAFQLCKELTQEKAVDAESIWSNLAGVSSHLNIPELQQLPQLIQQGQTLNSDRTTENIDSDRPLFTQQEKIETLLPDSIIGFAHPATASLPAIEGGVYPIRIHDTYAVDLTINYDSDRFPINLLSIANAEGCLLPSKINASIGQTLILFDRRLHPVEDYIPIATASVKEIAKADRSAAIPRLVGSGKLLGGEIYQYEGDRLDPTQRKHILVWLAASSETLELEEVGSYYNPLINLLCSRHKIQFAYYQARLAYKQARRLYGEIEPIINSFSQLKTIQNQWLKSELIQLKNQTGDRKLKQQITTLLNSSEAELTDRIKQHLQVFHNKRLENKLIESQRQKLEQLEQWLVRVPQTSVDYARCLRDMESHITTIEINALNYKRELHRLQQIGTATDDLSFLAAFLNNDCVQYQKQIEYDLKYLNSGKTLFDRTIESIRGLLTIDAQKQQLNEELAEGERDRRIEFLLTVVGSGLAVSALTSAIMPELVQPFLKSHNEQYERTWYGNPASLLTINVVLHSFIGIVTAIIVALVFRRAIESFWAFFGDRIRRR
ncbi:MAG: hypothetical protein AAGK10_17010 [Cyanobacteria bacterium J06555_3]